MVAFDTRQNHRLLRYPVQRFRRRAALRSDFRTAVAPIRATAALALPASCPEPEIVAEAAEHALWRVAFLEDRAEIREAGADDPDTGLDGCPDEDVVGVVYELG